MKICASTGGIDDSKDNQVVQVQYYNKITDVSVISPYGFSSNTPIDSIGVLFDINSSDNQAAIFNKPSDRFKNLVEWEVQVGNYKTKSSVKFEDSGNINIDAKAGGLIIKNDSEELIGWIEELVTAVEAITTNTQIGPQPVINKAAFTSLKSRIANLKG